jgi:hypothetical protein
VLEVRSSPEDTILAINDLLHTTIPILSSKSTDVHGKYYQTSKIKENNRNNENRMNVSENGAFL